MQKGGLPFMLNRKVLMIGGNPDNRGCIGCRKCSLQTLSAEQIRNIKAEIIIRLSLLLRYNTVE